MRIFKNFISEDEKRELKTHAIKLRKRGILIPNPVGPHRFYTNLLEGEGSTELIRNIGDRIMALLSDAKFRLDPMLGWTLSFIEPKGEVHSHFDKYRMPGVRHLRCNVVVSKDDDSGRPIIDGVTYDVGEGDMWMFFASEYEHGCEVVRGPKSRILYGYGFAIQNQDFELDKIVESK